MFIGVIVNNKIPYHKTSRNHGFKGFYGHTHVLLNPIKFYKTL